MATSLAKKCVWIKLWNVKKQICQHDYLIFVELSYQSAGSPHTHILTWYLLKYSHIYIESPENHWPTLICHNSDLDPGIPMAAPLRLPWFQRPPSPSLDCRTPPLPRSVGRFGAMSPAALASKPQGARGAQRGHCGPPKNAKLSQRSRSKHDVCLILISLIPWSYIFGICIISLSYIWPVHISAIEVLHYTKGMKLIWAKGHWKSAGKPCSNFSATMANLKYHFSDWWTLLQMFPSSSKWPTDFKMNQWINE